MEPTVTASLVIGILAVFGACVANMRFHSKCKNKALGLDISISKKFNENPSTPRTPPMRGSTSEDDETSI